MLAYYLHDLSPYVIRFGERFAIHKYGLAYVLGFYCCYLVMVHLAKKGFGALKPGQVADFITFGALFGVVLGGRLGFMLFYNIEGFLSNPLTLFKIWDGGMSSHGGIAGLALYSLWYAWQHKVSWTGIGDNLVVGSPLGILFGRLANFFNGELYGRPAEVAWAMKFPTELRERGMVPSQIGIFVENNEFPRYSNEIVALAKSTPEGLANLEAVLPPRHPSQLYEGALEGLMLFIILYLVRTQVKGVRNGVLTGLFFLIYAVVRIAVENFREPDNGDPLMMGITRGQFYSLFMIVIGLTFLIYGLKWGGRSTPSDPLGKGGGPVPAPAPASKP